MAKLSNLNAFGHIALRAGELSLVFDLQPNDEIEIMPEVVLVFIVLLEGDRLVVKAESCGIFLKRV